MVISQGNGFHAKNLWGKNDLDFFHYTIKNVDSGEGYRDQGKCGFNYCKKQVKHFQKATEPMKISTNFSY